MKGPSAPMSCRTLQFIPFFGDAMPLGQKPNHKLEPFGTDFADALSRMIREEATGINDYERLIELAGRIYPGGIENAAIRQAFINELSKIMRDERNHVLMLRAIQDKLFEAQRGP